jgi:hypothetical protein
VGRGQALDQEGDERADALEPAGVQPEEEAPLTGVHGRTAPLNCGDASLYSNPLAHAQVPSVPAGSTIVLARAGPIPRCTS